MAPRPSSNRRRWTGVLLASLALHALLLWGWATTPPPRPPAQARLQWIDAQPEPPPAAVAPSRAPPTAPTAPGQKKKRRPAEEAPPARADAPTRAAGASATLGTAPGGEVAVPGKVNLDPGLGTVLRLPPAADAEAPHGSTLRNGPGEEEDPVVAREVTGERLTRELNANLAEVVGKAAIAVGTVPGHFRRAEDAMRSLAGKSRIEVTPPSAGDTAREVANILLPGGISPEASRRVTDTPLGYSVMNQTVPVPGVDDQRFREQALSLMAATEELKKRVSEPRLKAILELVTDPYGVVADARVLERSGDRKFDESVLHLSRKAFRSLPDSDEKALGSAWWKTTWQFTWAPPPFPGLQADVRVKLLDAHRIPAAATQ